MVVDYVQKARVASPQVLAKARQYLQVGYQRLLNFECSGGGFEWYGRGPAVVWLSAYGLQEFSDMAKVYPVDERIIQRTQHWLMRQQQADGTWSDARGPHGNDAAATRLLVTSYVAAALLNSGLRDPRLEKSLAYIRNHIADAGGDGYILALAANALVAHDRQDATALEVLRQLEKQRQDKPEWNACYFPSRGQTLCYSHGNSAAVETTALTVLAMIKTDAFPGVVNQALTFLVKSKDADGTWGSTQATVLALKALVAGMGGFKQEEKVQFTVLINGKEAGKGEINDFNADVMQLFDLGEHTRTGKNEVALQVNGKTNMMFQIVGRHHETWTKPLAEKPPLEVSVDYDRLELSTAETLRAKATVRYHGRQPTYMVILDLGIPPGFVPDAEALNLLVGKQRVDKVTVTPRQITLYLGDVRPGDVLTYSYTLKPRFPLKVQSPPAVVYEYYTPANRAAARPVELTVTGK